MNPGAIQKIPASDLSFDRIYKNNLFVQFSLSLYIYIYIYIMA